MNHPTYRNAHTTAFVTLVVGHWLEREIAQWVHHEGSIPTAHRTMGYMSLLVLYRDTSAIYYLGIMVETTYET